MAETPETNKPDFRNGFPIRDLGDGSMISGHADGEELVLVRRGDEVSAIGAHCTHYGGPLAEGLIAGDTVRCPWHHACFSLRSGEALRAPALDPLQCWRVERLGDKIFVREKASPPGVHWPGRRANRIHYRKNGFLASVQRCVRIVSGDRPLTASRGKCYHAN